MKKEHWKEVYWLMRSKRDELEYPCDNCNDIDCGNCGVFDMLKKKHQIDVIDKRACLEQRKKELETYNTILRNKEFNPFTIRKCNMCKKKFHEDDMKLHTETKIEKGTKYYPVEMIHLCKRCNKSYIRSKKVIFKGYEKF